MRKTLTRYEFLKGGNVYPLPQQDPYVETAQSFAIVPNRPYKFILVFWPLFGLASLIGAVCFIPVWTSQTYEFGFLISFVGIVLFNISLWIYRGQKDEWNAGPFLEIVLGDVPEYRLPRLKKCGPVSDIESFRLVAGWPGDDAILEANGGCVSELQVRLKSGEEILIMGAEAMKFLDKTAERLSAFSGVPLIVNKQRLEYSMFGKPNLLD